MKVQFLQRKDLVTPLKTPPLDFRVKKFSRSVFGGCKSAEIFVTGYDLDLWNLLDLLRTPVLIDAPEGDRMWWGYIDSIKATVRSSMVRTQPRIQVSASLDGMSNRIAVAYTSANLSGEEIRLTTGWEDPGGNDPVSQSEFGIKELLWTLSSATTQHAEAARNKHLQEIKYPRPQYGLDFDAEESNATIYCSGWWNTMDWRYGQVPLQLALAYTALGNEVLKFGNNDIEMAAQGIQFQNRVNVAGIAVSIRKVGSPSDTVKVALYSAWHLEDDDQIIPIDELASGTIEASNITTDYQWITATMSAAYLAETGMYFIQISRSGSQDASNYYEITMDERAGYNQGELLVFEDPDWNATGKDLPFQIYSNDLVETTQQIISFIRNFGQFFRSIRLETSSGISIESYRNGDATALFETLQLLQMGTINNRRLLVDIDPLRNVTIYEEPPQPANPYLLFGNGSFAEPNKHILRNCAVPVGVWAEWVDIIPTSLDTSRLANPAKVFIDEMEYDAEKDRFSIIPRGAPNPFDFTKIGDG